MRFRGGLLAVTGLALVVALPGHRAAHPLTLDAPKRQAKEPFALVSRTDGARLTRVDERSLTPVGKRSASLGYVSSWAFAPGGGLVAVAAHMYENEQRDFVRFVDLRTLRRVRRTIQLEGYGRALLWARLDRLVAVTGNCCAPGTSVVTVDVGSRRVVSKLDLEGDVLALGRTADALVLLTTPRNRIGPARLDVVAADGAIRSVGLDRVQAGTTWPEDGSSPVGAARVPALAVDADGYRAVVVQPDGPAAEVDLRALRVSYHDLSAPRSALARLSAWLTPAAQAKGLNGPHRRGLWLGDGLVAVTGTDETASVDASNRFTGGSAPAGLAVVDTRDWTIETIDPGADSVTPADGLLLVTGRRWTSGVEKPTGMGLAAYGPDRALRFKLFSGSSSWVLAASGRRAYVTPREGETMLSVVDLDSGSVVGERLAPVPMPLLGDGPDY